MGNTPIYGFGYIEPNQDLSENIDLDELRFKAIENQMYNLYQIFKNGIIEDDPSIPSWRIQTYSNEFRLTKITITSGKGFVSYKAGKTSSSKCRNGKMDSITSSGDRRIEIESAIESGNNSSARFLINVAFLKSPAFSIASEMIKKISFPCEKIDAGDNNCSQIDNAFCISPDFNTSRAYINRCSV